MRDENVLSLGQKLGRVNWPFIMVITLLAGCGTAILYSVAGGSFSPWAERHALRYLAGLGLVFAVSVVSLRFWLQAAYPVFLVAVLGLALVPWFGIESGGARRWLEFGPVSVQPAEFAKIALILALARFFERNGAQDVLPGSNWTAVASRRGRFRFNLSGVLIPLLMIGVPTALVLVQPDLGTAVLIGAIGIIVMFLAGVNWFYFIAGGIGMITAAPFVVGRLRGYQIERILTFIDPERDPAGGGYHIIQSKIALGAGGLEGRGFMRGTQSQLNFLPEKHTDFIFPMFAEEMGYIGAVALMAVYVIACLLLTYMALASRSTFARLLISGVNAAFFLYVFINMAMVMGLLPIVGIPLPLISYGGSSMLTLMFGFGLCMSAWVHREQQFPRRN